MRNAQVININSKKIGVSGYFKILVIGVATIGKAVPEIKYSYLSGILGLNINNKRLFVLVAEPLVANCTGIKTVLQNGNVRRSTGKSNL